jgi:uncharacterized protein YbjT (DUF2867 family)
MTSWKPIVLVTGSTGRQGGAVARELLAAGEFHIRAMTRHPDGDAARLLAAEHAEVVHGDLDDPESLRHALNDVWGVFAMQNSWEAGVEREEQQGKCLVQLAREAGVSHFVYSSVGSADRNTGLDHFDTKWRIEEEVRAAGFPSHVVLRPVFFMENFTSPWFVPALSEGVLSMALKPETSLQMVAVADIGRFARLACERAKQMNGMALDLAGDSLRMTEAAAILGEAAGREVRFVQRDIEEVRVRSSDRASMLEWLDRVGYEADIEGLTAAHGIPLKRLREWATAVSWSSLLAVSD